MSKPLKILKPTIEVKKSLCLDPTCGITILKKLENIRQAQPSANQELVKEVKELNETLKVFLDKQEHKG